MGAAVDPAGVILAPVVLDAVHAVTVTAWDGNRIIWELQTYRAVKLLLCPQFSAHSDCQTQLNRDAEGNKKRQEKGLNVIFRKLKQNIEQNREKCRRLGARTHGRKMLFLS